MHCDHSAGPRARMGPRSHDLTQPATPVAWSCCEALQARGSKVFVLGGWGRSPPVFALRPGQAQRRLSRHSRARRHSASIKTVFLRCSTRSPRRLRSPRGGLVLPPRGPVMGPRSHDLTQPATPVAWSCCEALQAPFLRVGGLGAKPTSLCSSARPGAETLEPAQPRQAALGFHQDRISPLFNAEPSALAQPPRGPCSAPSGACSSSSRRMPQRA